MKKILLVVALVVGFCLLTVMGNCASLEDQDVVTFNGTTGYAKLTVQGVSFTFDRIQPGERLGVSWWIRNDSSDPCPLEVKVSVVVTGSPKGYLTANFYPGYTLQMGPNLCRNVALTVTMDIDAPPWTGGESFTVTVTFDSTVKGDRKQNPFYHTKPW